VQFSENLIIFNVLYIPDFTFKLIYVQTLIKDLNCVLTFSIKTCQIQSNSTLRMIGHAKFINGLYYLQTLITNHKDFVFPNVALNCIKNNIDLWHFGLGYNF